MYCESISCGQKRFEFQALALKKNPAFSVNISGPSSENYRENWSFVSLVLAASISNVKVWGRNNSPEEYKEIDRGTRCVICSWIYLPLCVRIWNEMTKLWTWPLTQQKHVYSTAPGVYFNCVLNLDFRGGAEKSVSDFLQLFV